MDTNARLYIAAEAVGTLQGLLSMAVFDHLPAVKARVQDIIKRYDATFDLPAVTQPEKQHEPL